MFISERDTGGGDRWVVPSRWLLSLCRLALGVRESAIEEFVHSFVLELGHTALEHDLQSRVVGVEDRFGLHGQIQPLSRIAIDQYADLRLDLQLWPIGVIQLELLVVDDVDEKEVADVFRKLFVRLDIRNRGLPGS